MFVTIGALAQPGVLPTALPTAVIPVGGMPLAALVPLAFLGAGLVSVLVLIAKERRARVARRSEAVRPGEPSLPEAA